ncbi:DUF302 domain-containing protein [Aliiruegeria sabulilitoris]|uniref:DUF302 domain-containing protein n=1 Tax=Aliiruegeria sabulilitoris TaxID=1510458 RepID=UPI00082F7C80|nr:DUF302 domain-containing protein [Aliiruegeria sabulilitoris]NDR56594.1 DUF302 domain-containing protein [Pseudoruegeria sp. M32A2M]
MRFAAIMALAASLATPGLAEDIVSVRASGDVETTMDALEAAVGKAGATVFARVDHSGGAESVGMTLPGSQLLVFGNPMLGTPAMQDDPLAGLYLPLRVLVYEDGDGAVWLAYEDPAEMLDDLEIDDDAEYLGKMSGALSKLTAAAAGG